MVTNEPSDVARPFHAWVSVWLAGQLQCSIQLFTAPLADARTVTLPWKPCGHEPTTAYSALHAPGGGLLGPGFDGPGLDGLVLGGGSVPPPMPVTSPLP